MADFTPTTDDVRLIYVEATEGHREDDPDEAGRTAEFDRWLAAHDAETRREALEGARAIVREARSANYDNRADWTEYAEGTNAAADWIEGKLGALSEKWATHPRALAEKGADRG